MDWHREIVSATVVSIAFFVIFTIAELWRKFGNPSAEATRKFVHLSSGGVSLFFSYAFQSHWTLLALGAAFVTILLISEKLGLLQSVHGVERSSLGQVYYPIAVYVTFLITSEISRPEYYLIAISVLAVADTVAALAGKNYGSRRYRVEHEHKSFEGSVTFFLATFIIVHLGLLLLSNIGRVESVVASLVIAALVTGFEALSLNGTDNLFIPFGTLLLLVKFTRNPLEEMFHQIGIIALIFALIFAISLYAQKLSMAGTMGVALFGYAAWSLVDFNWFLPIITGFAIYSLTNLWIEPKKDKFRIRSVFYLAILPMIWIMIANYFYPEHSIFLVPFIVSLVGNYNILWQRKIRLSIATKGENLRWWDRINFLFRAMILTLIFIPVHSFFVSGINIFFAMAVCFAGLILSDRIYGIVSNKIQNSWGRLAYFRMGAAVVAASSVLVFGLNYFLVR